MALARRFRQVNVGCRLDPEVDTRAYLYTGYPRLRIEDAPADIHQKG